jgi:threonine dehydrogenase-like Zn-dependent dehydrogenase
MKAIALTPGTTNVHLVDRPEPRVQAPNEVKLRVLQVGICGTDREEASGGRADAPIFEATGVAALEFDLLSALGTNGADVLTGIPGGDRPVQVPGAALMRQLVLSNQVLVGSVNASAKHFEMGVHDLTRARQLWGDAIDSVITHRHPYQDFAAALSHHGADEIKTVIEWARP